MPPRGIRLAGPPQDQSPPPPPPPPPIDANDDENFSPSQIPPPNETPPRASPPNNPHHFKKRSDVTMRAEYEMELDRKHNMSLQHHLHQKSANLDGTGSERQALFDEKGRPITGAASASLFGETSEDEQLQIARDALKAAQIRQKQTDADVRRAKQELEHQRTNVGAVSSSSTHFNRPSAATPIVNHNNTEARRQLQESAKQRREQLELEKKAARDQKENGIFRGPEVAQVAVASQNLKSEIDFICQDTLDVMEAAIARLREEKDQLMIRLERTERFMNDDIARAEGELHWIDYASAEAKKMIDEANRRRELEERVAEKKKMKSSALSTGLTPTSSAAVANEPQRSQWK